MRFRQLTQEEIDGIIWADDDDAEPEVPEQEEDTDTDTDAPGPDDYDVAGEPE